MRRLVGCFATALVAALGVAGPAGAWTWPLHGEVLRPFSLGADAYAAGPASRDRRRRLGGRGRRRADRRDGDASSESCRPMGVWSRIQTEDGLSVTIAHLGSSLVARGARVAEGDVVGRAGPSGESEHSVPYVHLGVRRASIAEGYLDPLRFLPPRVADGADRMPAQPVVAPDVAPDAVPEEVSPAVPEAPGPTVGSPSAVPGQPASTPGRVGSALGGRIGPGASVRSAPPVVPSRRSAPASVGATHVAIASATRITTRRPQRQGRRSGRSVRGIRGPSRRRRGAPHAWADARPGSPDRG